MQKIIETFQYTNEIIDKVVDCLINNKIVIMPSDTIYGFLARMENENELRKIKKRDEKPFLNLISKYSHLESLNIDVNSYKKILEKNWPGSITFLMFDRNNKKIGVRMPDLWVLQRILDKIDIPLLSTSVNFSGQEALNDIDEIVKNFYDYVDLIVNLKNFKPKSASTIVDLTTIPYTIIRKGDKEFKC